MLKRIVLLGLGVCVVGLTGCTANLKKENANLRSQLAALEARRDQLAEENRGLRTDLGALQGALTEARTDARRMSGLVDELRGEQEKLQQQTLELKKLLDDFAGISVEARSEGNFIVMESEILFDLGKAELSEAATSSLDRVAEYLLAHNELPLRIDGHTDGVPIVHSPWKDNYHLAAMRAHAVMGYLVGKGVSPDRMYIAGFGPNKPLQEPPEPTAPVPQNRRVEIMLVPTGVRSISEILEGFQE
ncbi:MAG: OmpA/MotB family protein [Planctomycetota bacterium]|jgi:chemotaxis protein MotB